MQNYKTVVTMPEWARMFADGAMHGTADAYNLVPVLYRAVQLRCDSLASVRIITRKKGTDTEVEFPFDIDLYDYIWRTEAASILAGAAYWLKLTNKAGSRVAGLKFLNPFSVTVNYTGAISFTQSGIAENTGEAHDFGPWDSDRMVYFREYNPTDDVRPGVGDAGVALQDAGLIRYLTRFASIFFENGAMPLTILEVPPGTQKVDTDRIESYFKRAATGIKNAWSAIAVRSGGLKVTTLTPPLDQLAIPELQQQARRSVAVALKIPQTMLEDAANFATAKEHRLSFWQDTIRPRGMKLQGVINRQLLNTMGLECEFAFDELDIFQEDEANRAASLQQLTSAGVPLLTAMDILGYDLTDEERAAIEQKPEPAPVVINNVVADQDEPDDAEEIRRWMRKSINSLERGKSPVVEFISDKITPAKHAAIMARLGECKTRDEIMAAFDNEPRDDRMLVELKRANDLLEAMSANN